MFRTSITRLTILGILLFLLTACGQSATPTPTATPEPPVPTVPPAPTTAGMRTFTVISDESQASYLADEEFFAGALAKLGVNAGLEDVVGSSTQVSGYLQLNLAGPDYLGESQISVDLSALKTQRAQRDKWIQEDGPNFGRFPLAQFVPTEIRNPPATYQEGTEVSFQLVGNLTIREITQPAIFEVTAALNGSTITGLAETRVLLSDFGIEPPNFANTLSVKDEIGIRVQLTARAD